jgi:two-component sensor histidine kinase
MAIHELGTNAIKYGVLSNDDGRVDITWKNSPTFEFRWQEKNGPLVVEPSSRRELVSVLALSIELLGLTLAAKSSFSMNPQE